MTSSLIRWLAAGFLTLAGFQVQANDLRDFITDLYGGDGIFLPAAEGVPTQIAAGHQAHFEGPALAELAELSDGILSGAGIFALNSTVTGVSFDLSTGVPQTVQDSLGPLLSERATTLGDGRWTLGFGYTRQDFKELDGESLSDLQVSLPHQDCCFEDPPPFDPDGQLTGFELDEILLDIDMELKQDVFAIFSNYGVTDKLDVGVVVPIVRLEARARSAATIVYSGPDSVITIPPCADPNGCPVHSFEGDPSVVGQETPDSPISETGDTKTGIGDVILRGKYHFLEDGQSFADMAILLDVTLPTGKEKDLLGTGETQFRGMYILSKQLGRFTPHLNVGYSVPTGNKKLEKLTYAVGGDARLTPQFTLAADVLGRYNPNVKTIGNHVIDLAIAAKWNPFRDRNVPLNAFVSFPLNNDGLRADVVWGLGFDIIL
jgi:hypothetical protein